MSFRLTAAAPAIRSLFVRPHTVTSHQFVRRLAQDSGAGHTHAKKASDLPWIIGAVVFTIPSSLYLLSGSSKPAHSPAGHGHASKVEKGSQHISDAASDAASDQAHEATGKVREKAGELYDETKSKTELSTAGVSDAPAVVKETSSEELEDLADEVKKQADEYTGSEESSGKDVESEEVVVVEKPSDVGEPKVGMKEPTSTNMQNGKQQGISNQDTGHPVLHDERGQAISKKSEGMHETAKLKGTVDPSRETK